MDTGETVRMLRVPGMHRHPSWTEADTVEHRFTEQDEQTINSMSGSHELYVNAGKLTPTEIKQRQVAYMTAAVMWFMLFCVALIIGSEVWKLCVHIASS